MKKFLAVLAAFGLALGANAADKTYKLKLASTWESTTPVLGDAAKEFKRVVETLSDGRLEVRIDYPSKHKAPFGILDFVKGGQYDIGYTASYCYKEQGRRRYVFAAAPSV